MTGYVIELDGFPLVEQVTKNGHHVDQLRIFKTKEEVAAKLIIVATSHPKWQLNFYEAPDEISITPTWFRKKGH